MSEPGHDAEYDDEITTEPADPLAGADDSVAKTGERLQEKADAVERNARSDNEE